MPREVPGFTTAGEALKAATARRFADYPAELQAAVNAYDDARRDAHTDGIRVKEPAMSDANKATIAPMIMAAVRAYVEASNPDCAA